MCGCFVWRYDDLKLDGYFGIMEGMNVVTIIQFRFKWDV